MLYDCVTTSSDLWVSYFQEDSIDSAGTVVCDLELKSVFILVYYCGVLMVTYRDSS